MKENDWLKIQLKYALLAVYEIFRIYQQSSLPHNDVDQILHKEDQIKIEDFSLNELANDAQNLLKKIENIEDMKENSEITELRNLLNRLI